MYRPSSYGPIVPFIRIGAGKPAVGLLPYFTEFLMTTCRIPISPSTLEPPQPETHPPRIERMAVHPYPDLKRLWVRVQLTYFQRHPNVRLLCLDEQGAEVGEMLLVEWRDPYISLTMHLRRSEPGANYVLRAEVARDNELLDTQDYPFQLVFTDVNE